MQAKSEWDFTNRKLLISICLLTLSYLFGCAAIRVAGDVQKGRNALQTGRPNDAIGYLMRAAEVDPAYKIPYRVPVGVLAYLGRAYYETGKDGEARKVLEEAVSLNRDDSLAHLYLGLTLLRTGDQGRGRKEIEVGLKGIHEVLERIASDNIFGIFWDPGRTIRSDIETTLSSKLDDSELAAAAVRIGSAFDSEIDEARRDQARRRFGGGGGNGN